MIALIQMSSHHDDAEHRKSLYKTYLTFSVIIGIPLLIATQLYIYYHIFELGTAICSLINSSSTVNCIFPTAAAAGAIWGEVLFNAAIILCFRLYFVSVMKKYYESAHHGENMMHQPLNHHGSAQVAVIYQPA